jgi:hypothetical protein
MESRDDDAPSETDETPSDERDTLREKLEALVPEIVKRTFSAGMGAVFTTEEGIRRIAKEISLPKDVAGYLANTAGATKDEVVRIVAREVREFLERMNLSEEVTKLLTTLSFEIKTEIRFIPNSEKYTGLDPDVSTKMRMKRSDEKDGKEKDKDGKIKDRDGDRDKDKVADEPPPLGATPLSGDEERREGGDRDRENGFRRWRRRLRRDTASEVTPVDAPPGEPDDDLPEE